MGSGHGHQSETENHVDSMSMDASFQHTKLGTLHEARHCCGLNVLMWGYEQGRLASSSLYGRRTVGATGNQTAQKVLPSRWPRSCGRRTEHTGAQQRVMAGAVAVAAAEPGSLSV